MDDAILTAEKSEYNSAVEKLKKFCEEHTTLTVVILDEEYPLRIQFAPDPQQSFFGNENIDENGEINDMVISVGLDTTVASTLNFELSSDVLKKLIKKSEKVGFLYYHAFRSEYGRIEK